MTELSKVITTFQRYPGLFQKHGWVLGELFFALDSDGDEESGATMHLVGPSDEPEVSFRSATLANLTSPYPFLYVLLSAELIEMPNNFGPLQIEELISQIQEMLARLFAKSSKRQPIRDFLDQDDLAGLLDKERGPENLEGVTDERSYRVSEEKYRAAAEAKAVGEMFEKARRGVGLNKVAAAKVTGIARPSILSFEKGEHDPGLERIRQIADAYGFEARIELIPKGKS